MYIPTYHEENRTEVLHGLMRANPLATIVTHSSDGLAANHIPLLLQTDAGEHGVLRGHVARANPMWRQFSEQAEALLIFQGPQAYISPSWCPSKQQHGKVVPTWNYAVVHAHGIPRVIEDAAWLLDHLAALSDTHEAGQAMPWKLSDAPADFAQRLLDMIVGIEIPIHQLMGKWKVSQNRLDSDKLGIAAGLQAQGEGASHDMAALVLQSLRAQPAGQA